MKKIIPYLFLPVMLIIIKKSSTANTINANPANYVGFLNTLIAGDTLKLAAGNYINTLTINNINGTAINPIVIMGSGITTNFQGQSCCNTVSITKCS